MVKITVVGFFLLVLTFTGLPIGHAYLFGQGASTGYPMVCPPTGCPPHAIAQVGLPQQMMIPGQMGPTAEAPRRISKCKPPLVAACGPAPCPPPCGPVCFPVCKPPVRWY